MNNGKDVSWERLVEALNQIKETELADRISEEFCSPATDLKQNDLKMVR